MSEVEGVRRAVRSVQPYAAGKTIEEVKREYGLEEVVKLGSNENPYAPFPRAAEAMRAEVATLHSYPDSSFEEIKDFIGGLYGLSRSHVAVAHGAGGMLETLARTFIEEGDQVILPRQSYRLYPEISKLMGAEVIETELTGDYRLDLKAMRGAVTPSTKLIWLCNPNNPTGTLFDLEDYHSLKESLPEGAWIVLDEAYAEFADPALLPDSPREILAGPVIAVRTFSKAYGLAGARLGYALARPEVIRVIDTVAEPFNANRVGIAGATAVLRDELAYARRITRKITESRRRTEEALRDRGYEVVTGHGNFVFFAAREDARTLAERMLERGVIVRAGGAWGFPEHLRISVGTEAEMERFLAVFDAVAAPGGVEEEIHG